MLKKLKKIALAATLVAIHAVGQAEDIGAAVVYLASRAAAYVTGATLHVNGGMYMT